MTSETLAQLSSEERAILNGWLDEQAPSGDEIDQMVEQLQQEGF